MLVVCRLGCDVIVDDHDQATDNLKACPLHDTDMSVGSGWWCEWTSSNHAGYGFVASGCRL